MENIIFVARILLRCMFQPSGIRSSLVWWIASDSSEEPALSISTIYRTLILEQHISLISQHFVGSQEAVIRGATQNFREFARNNMNTYFKS